MRHHPMAMASAALMARVFESNAELERAHDLPAGQLIRGELPARVQDDLRRYQFEGLLPAGFTSIALVDVFEGHAQPSPGREPWWRIHALVRCDCCRTLYGVGRAHRAWLWQAADPQGEHCVGLVYSEAGPVGCPARTHNPLACAAEPILWRPRPVRLLKLAELE